MNPAMWRSRESEVGLGTAATKDERQEDGEEGRREAGGGGVVGGGLGGWRRSVPMPIPFRVRAGVE